MTELDGSPRTDSAPGRGLMVGVAVALAGLVALAYWLERLYDRWWAANHPFAGAKARVRHVRTVVHDRRAGLAEGAGLLWEVASEVDRATRQERSSHVRSADRPARP